MGIRDQIKSYVKNDEKFKRYRSEEETEKRRKADEEYERTHPKRTRPTPTVEQQLAHARYVKEKELKDAQANKVSLWDAITKKDVTLADWKQNKEDINNKKTAVSEATSVEQQYKQSRKSQNLQALSDSELDKKIEDARKIATGLTVRNGQTMGVTVSSKAGGQSVYDRKIGRVEYDTLVSEKKRRQAEKEEQRIKAIYDNLGKTTDGKSVSKMIDEYARIRDKVSINNSPSFNPDIDKTNSEANNEYYQQLAEYEKKFKELGIDNYSELADYSQRIYNKQSTQDTVDEVSEWAKDHKVGAAVIGTALEIPASLSTLRGTLSSTDDYDINSSSNLGYNIKTALNDTVKSSFEDDWFLRGETKAKLYDFGQSMANSMASAFVPGVTTFSGEIAMGVSAFASTYNQMRQQGIDHSNALVIGGLAGVAEGAMEHLPLEALRMLKPSNKLGATALISNYVKSMLGEATEEGVTEIANIIAETLIAGGNSSLLTQYNDLVESGISREKAWKTVVNSAIAQIGEAALSGALMGGIMGAGGVALNKSVQDVSRVINGSQLYQSGEVDSVINDASDKLTNNKSAQKIVSRLAEARRNNTQGKDGASSSKSVGVKNEFRAGKLSEMVDKRYRNDVKKAAMNAVKNRVRELGGNTNDTRVISSAIIKTFMGEDLKSAERKAFDNYKFSRRILNELSDLNSTTSNKWTESFKTDFEKIKDSYTSYADTDNKRNDVDSVENYIDESSKKNTESTDKTVDNIPFEERNQINQSFGNTEQVGDNYPHRVRPEISFDNDFETDLANAYAQRIEDRDGEINKKAFASDFNYIYSAGSVNYGIDAVLDNHANDSGIDDKMVQQIYDEGRAKAMREQQKLETELSPRSYGNASAELVAVVNEAAKLDVSRDKAIKSVKYIAQYAALNNKPFVEARRNKKFNGYVNLIGERLAKRAFEAGVNNKGFKKQRSSQSAYASKNASVKYSRSFNENDLTDAQKKNLENIKPFIDAMSKKLGVNIVIEGDLKSNGIGGNGAYIHTQNAIYVSATANNMFGVLSHEPVHFLRVNNAKGYAALEKACEKFYEEVNEGSVRDALMEIAQLYDTLDTDEIKEEFVASTIEGIMSSYEGADRFVDFVFNSDEFNEIEEKSILRSLADIIMKIISTLYDIIKDGKFSTSASKIANSYARTRVDLAQNIRDVFIRALEEIEKRDDNGQKENTVPGGDVKWSLSPTKRARLEAEIDELGQKRITLNADKKRITVLTDDFTKDKNIYSKKSSNDRQVNARIKAIPDFDKIITSSSFDRTDTEIHGLKSKAKKGVVAIHHFSSQYNGWDIDILIRDKGKKQYLYEMIFEEEKSSQQSMAENSTSTASSNDDVASKKIIQQSDSDVKPLSGDIKKSLVDEEYLEAVKSGDEEKQSQLVEKAAKEAGYTKKMFHETNAVIHVFDLSNTTHSNGDYQTPFGIFTKSSNKSIGLGNKQMSLFVKAKKTFEVSNRDALVKMLPKEYQDFVTKIKAVDDKYSKEIVSLEDNYLDIMFEYSEAHPDEELTTEMIAKGETFNDERCITAKKAYDDKMNEWKTEYNKAGNEARAFFTEWLKSNGYDSMYLKMDKGSFGRSTDSFIVLNENQVKSADPVTYDDAGNVIPLSERFNSNEGDIRWSFTSKKVDDINNISYNKDDCLSTKNRATTNKASSISWVFKAKIFSINEIQLYNEKLGEIARNENAFKRNKQGDYIVPINNKVVITNGSTNEPFITKIVEIMSNDYTEIATIRSIVENGEYDFGRQNKNIRKYVESFYGQGYIVQYDGGNNRVSDWITGRRSNKSRAASIRAYLSLRKRKGLTTKSSRQLWEKLNAGSGGNTQDDGIKSQLTERERTEDAVYSLSGSEFYDERFAEIAKASKRHEELLTKLMYEVESIKFEGGTDMAKVRRELRKTLRSFKIKASSIDFDAVSQKLARAYDNFNKKGGDTYLAERLLDEVVDTIYESVEDEIEITEEAKAFLKVLRTTEFRLSEAQKNEVKARHGSVGRFYRKAFGKLAIRNEATSTLDRVFKDLSEDETIGRYAYLFEGIADTEQPDAILGIYNMIKEGRGEGQADIQTVNREEEKEFLRMALREASLHVATKGDMIVRSNRTLAHESAVLQKELNRIMDEYYAEREKIWKQAYSDAYAELANLRDQARERYEDAVGLIKAGDIRLREIARMKADIKVERQKRLDTIAKQNMREQIKKKVNILNRNLTRPSSKGSVPQALRKSVARFLSMLSDTGVFDYEKIDMLKEAYDNLEKNIDREQTEISMMYDKDISDILYHLKSALHEDGQKLRLSGLNYDELVQVMKLVTHISAIVNNANEMFINGKKESFAELSGKAMNDVRKMQKSKIELPALIGVNNMTPAYFFKKIGGQLSAMWKDIRRGQDTYVSDVNKAKRFAEKVTKEFDVKKWENTVKNYTTVRGEKLEFTIGQLLTIYATFKRERSSNIESGHLMKGGIVYESDYKFKSEDKKHSRDREAHPLALDDLVALCNMLTPERKRYADKMVKYLSTDMAMLGNEVAMQLYGYTKFDEQYYFPFNSEKSFLYERFGEGGEARLKTMGFTNQRVPFANNPLVLSDFNQVWRQHVERMSAYHSFTIPLENFQRVWNAKTPGGDGEKASSVKGLLADRLGNEYATYVSRLMSDINGGAMVDSRERGVDKYVRLFKANAVMMSASVAIQRPSAIARAMAYINPKYFVASTVRRPLRSYEECKKYCPVAVLKETGGFDTGTGFGIAESIVDTIDGKSKFEKAREKANDIGGFAPEKLDAITWGHIWEAVKKEQKAKTGLSGEALLEKAAERFAEVIDLTQVYDSTLSRSGNMRAKGVAMKGLTAFMAEPTITINMVADAFRELKKGNKGFFVGAMSALVCNVVLNAALKSIVSAARHMDDDDNYLEQYIEELIGNIFDDANPISYLPFVKDIISLIEGYDVTSPTARSINEFIKRLKNSVKEWDDVDSAWDATKAIGNDLSIIAYALGIPISNLNRDVWAAVSAISSAVKGNETSSVLLKEAFKNGMFPLTKSIDEKWLGGKIFKEQSKPDKFFDAWTSNDKVTYTKIYNTYTSDQSARTALSTGTKNAFLKGEISRQEAIKLLQRLRYKYPERTVDNWAKGDTSSDDDDNKYSFMANMP